jgi:inosine/xanthosine triphosphatase
VLPASVADVKRPEQSVTPTTEGLYINYTVSAGYLARTASIRTFTTHVDICLYTIDSRSDGDETRLYLGSEAGAVHLVVGSENPVKREATARVFPEATVDPLGVDSGVSEQPTSHAETLRGARYRAERAFAARDADLAVGIEGGVAPAPVEPDSLWPDADRAIDLVGADRSLVMWAAVTDGERLAAGGGPTLPLPDHIATRIDAGEELGPVMDDVLGMDDVAKKQGAAGAFTAGRLTRTDALEAAVAAAAGPFLSDHY